MSISQAIVSGVVQGVTEFFPISSSGHLVLVHSLFGLKEPEFAFDIFLHLGTLVSILIFFRKEILALFGRDRNILFFLIIGSIPAAVLGFLFKDSIERSFGSPRFVGYTLVLTGIWLSLASLYIKKIRGKNRLSIPNSIVIGLAQGVAILPGISRSGATIATGVLLGLDGELSFRFSFLLAIPAIFGASVLKVGKIGSSLLSGEDFLYFLTGGVTAMLVGLAAIKILLRLIKDKRLIIFGIYCILVGSIVIAFLK